MKRDDSDLFRLRRNIWAVLATVGGLAFVLCALLGAPGLLYAVVAVCLGGAYTLAATFTRPAGSGRDRNRNRNR